MSVLKIIFVVFEALFALNLLIFVHELGHFFAARWRGMQVDRFAIWFGKPIWKKKIGGVEYALGWIPAGGYVSLPQMATMEVIEGKGDSTEKPLPAAPPLDKIIVAFAGPLFSFLLAIAFAIVVWGVGKPEQVDDDSTVIGWVRPDGPAWQSGLRPGDKILEIDGGVVRQFSPVPNSKYSAGSQESVMWRIITSEGTNIAVKYSRAGQEHTAYPVPVKPLKKWYERKSMRQIGIAPSTPATIAIVLTNSPAALAGLHPNDEVIAINGEKIFAPNTINDVESMMTNGVKPVTLTVRRGREQFDCTLVAEKPLKPANADPVFGMAFWYGSTNEVLVHPHPIDQIKASAGQIVATVKTVVSRKSDVGLQQVGGAVMIIRAYKNFFDSENGWRRVLWFSVLLNVNLAMLNMLPLPILDGGHILLALIEAVRRRSVSAKLLEYIQSGFAVVLICFMLFIAFFDIGDWVRSARGEREVPMVFAPKSK